MLNDPDETSATTQEPQPQQAQPIGRDRQSPGMGGLPPPKATSMTQAPHAGVPSVTTGPSLDPNMAAFLKVVVLNGCKTETIARRLVAEAPRLSVVCWRTLAEDNAARAFSVGFYASVASQLEARRAAIHAGRSSSRWRNRKTRPPRPFSIDEAFESGCEEFRASGFIFGDPEAYFHKEPNHPHLYRPNFQTCEQCTPPVHGQVVLLRGVVGSTCEEVEASNFFPRLSVSSDLFESGFLATSFISSVAASVVQPSASVHGGASARTRASGGQITGEQCLSCRTTDVVPELDGSVRASTWEMQMRRAASLSKLTAERAISSGVPRRQPVGRLLAWLRWLPASCRCGATRSRPLDSAVKPP